MINGVQYINNYRPVNTYFNGVKVAGWQYTTQTGQAVTINNTYNDIAAITVTGRTVQGGTPAPAAPVTVTSATGNLTANGTAIAIPTLRSVGGVSDTYNPMTGEHVQRIGVQTFTGAEGWTMWGDSADYINNNSYGYYWYTLPVASVDAYYQMISTHFRTADLAHMYAPGYISRRGATTTLTVNVSRDIASVAAFRAWLTAQYTAGTPIAVYYQLATPVTTMLTPVTVPSYYPSTTYTTDGAVKAQLAVTAKIHL